MHGTDLARRFTTFLFSGDSVKYGEAGCASDVEAGGM